MHKVEIYFCGVDKVFNFILLLKYIFFIYTFVMELYFFVFIILYDFSLCMVIAKFLVRIGSC